MPGLRWRSSSVVTALAVSALCFSLQPAQVVSGKDKPVPAAIDDSSAAAAAHDDADTADAERGDKDAKPAKRTAKGAAKKKARPETPRAKKKPDADSKEESPLQNSSGGGVLPPVPGGQSGGTGGTSDSKKAVEPAKSGEKSSPARPVRAKGAPAAKGNTAKGAAEGNAAAPPAAGPNPALVKKVMEIQDRNHADLIAQKGIVGTGTGLDDDGNVVIRVYTSGADSPKIPATLEGVKVVEILKGPTHLYQAQPARRQRQLRATPIGVSAFDDVDLSATSCAAGTLGCRLVDNHGNVYALSNNHVFAGENLTQGGVQLGITQVVQPSPGDNNCVIGITGDRLGVLTAYVPVDLTATGSNVVDCAIVKTTSDLLNTSTLSDGYGVPTFGSVKAFLGQKVQKYGRTTGFTRGVVTALNVAFPIAYANGTANFVGQIEVSGDAGFASLGAPGDSGSLVVDMNRTPVALLFAGGGGLTDCNPIDAVLAALAGVAPAQAGLPGGTRFSVDGGEPSLTGKEGRSTPNSP